MTEAINTIKALVEGVYALRHWHVEGKVFSPPQVEGRFVLRDGAAVVILHNRIYEGRYTTATFFGRYHLRPGEFAYGYDTPAFFAESIAGITVSHAAPWQGLRAFAVNLVGATVHLRAVDSAAEFVFDENGFTYFEDGHLLREWSRVTS